MKQIYLAVIFISVVACAPKDSAESIENEQNVELQPAQFMGINPMMMGMNPMMMNPMMMNPMMMNPMMMNPMMMGGSCGRCSVMCLPTCTSCCCNNTCDNPTPEEPNSNKPDMHESESTLIDEIIQRLLDRPTNQYPPDIIVSRPRRN